MHYRAILQGLTVLTVSSRLTKDPKVSVLVIEAGGDKHTDPRVNDVRTYGLAFYSELDWNIISTLVPRQNDTGLLLVVGRMLGGSGSLDHASWTKGPSSQYDLLPMLTGGDSWAWESFNNYMFKAEHFNLPDAQDTAIGAQYHPGYHGFEGPIDVSLQTAFSIRLRKRHFKLHRRSGRVGRSTMMLRTAWRMVLPLSQA
jgi:choline dehydrogenase